MRPLHVALFAAVVLFAGNVPAATQKTIRTAFLIAETTFDPVVAYDL